MPVGGTASFYTNWANTSKHGNGTYKATWGNFLASSLPNYIKSRGFSSNLSLVGIVLSAALVAVAQLDGTQVARIVTTLGGAALLLGWVVGPILIAGAETTVDAEKLAPFPLTARQVMAALTATGLTGIPGIVTTLVWRTVPRWFATLLYVLLGWVATWFLPSFWRAGGAAVVWLILAGGIVYTLGGAVYARRWPNPAPRWFGFHEIFHVCTVLAWACQCVACFIAVLG